MNASRTNNNRGLFIPLVIGIIIVLFVIIIAFSYTVRSQRRNVSSIFKKEIAFNLAEAGLEQASAYFNSGESTLYQRLTDPGNTAASLRGAREAFDDADFKYLETLADRYGASVKVEMIVQENLAGLWDSQRLSGAMHDMNERAGHVLMRAEVTAGGRTWTKEALKEVKVINILPSILSKFTLFTRTPLSDLNPFLNNKNGSLISPADRRPLYLYHGPAGETGNAIANGWIFLGGGTWRFNLTSGWGTGYVNGEDFHYLAFDRLCVFDHTEPGHDNLDEDHVAKILHRGFHKDLEIRGPDALLPNNAGRRSNCIHLFGTADRRSPTLVMGRVFRRYAQYGAICCADPDPADTLYPPKVILPYVSRDRWSGYHQMFPEDLVNFPRYPAHLVKPDVFGVNDYEDRGGTRGFGFYMSKIVDENELDQGHYNNSYDMITQGNSWYSTPERKLATPLLSRVIEPPPSSAGDLDYFYSVDNGDEPGGAGGLCIKRDDGTVMFRGNLNDAATTLMDDLESKALLEVTAGEFKEMYLDLPARGGPLEVNLDTVVMVSGSLNLDRPMVVKRGGIVVVERNVVLSEGISCDPSSSDGRAALTICSRSGSIIIKTGAEIQAVLVALDGSLVKDNFDRPLAVRGSVVVGKLNENTVFSASSAGSIEYDRRFDPLDSENYEKCYRSRILPREIAGRFFQKM